MLEGVPILDFKPYLSSVPVDQLTRGWFAEVVARRQRHRGGSASATSARGPLVRRFDRGIIIHLDT